MPLENSGSRLSRYIRRAVCRHEFRKSHRDELVDQINEVLSLIEVREPGILVKIEGQLSGDEEFRGSIEQRTLRMAIDSVVGQHRRRGQVHETSLEGVDPQGGEDPALLAEQEELKSILKTEIDNLPERDRAVLRKVYEEGRSQSEVSRELDIPKSTLNDMLQRIVGGLARRIGECPNSNG